MEPAIYGQFGDPPIHAENGGYLVRCDRGGGCRWGCFFATLKGAMQRFAEHLMTEHHTRLVIR